MATEYTQVDLADGGEVEQAARILKWVADEKTKISAKLKSLEEMESNARSVVEDALGGAEGPASEGLYQGRPLVRWSKFTTHRFNGSALKKKYPEIHEEFYEAKTGRTFTLIPEPKEES